MRSSGRRRVFLAGSVVLLLLVAGWYKLRTAPATPAPDQGGTTSAPPAARRERGKDVYSARQVADAWFDAASAAPVSDGESSVITITSQDSPARRAAFRDLLEKLDPGNAAALHDLATDAASRDEPGAFNDAEWKTFLEKWGRLAGVAALAHFEGTPELASRAPGLLRGVAASNPAAASAWLQEHAPLEEDQPWRATAQRELILGWLQNDFEGPAQWFRDHPDDPAFDEILTAFAAEAAVKDAESAFEWAKAVEGPWRAFAIENVAREWLARDPQQASAALADAGYTPEMIALLATPGEGHDITRPPKASQGSKTADLHVESGGVSISE